MALSLTSVLDGRIVVSLEYVLWNCGGKALEESVIINKLDEGFLVSDDSGSTRTADNSEVNFVGSCQLYNTLYNCGSFFSMFAIPEAY